MWCHFPVGVLFLSAMVLVGAELPKPVLLSQSGIQSVNGSNLDTNCLVDGLVPHINTSLYSWASDLVTLTRRPYATNVHFAHVLLTFEFENPVIVTSIEMDLFLCTEWGIGAPYIGLYADNHSQFIYDGNDFLMVYSPPAGTCGCLSKISVPVQRGEPPYPFWHILITFPNAPSMQWVHVGEVVFRNATMSSDANPTTSTDCIFEPPPDTELTAPFPATSSVVPVSSLTLSTPTVAATPLPQPGLAPIIVNSPPPPHDIPPYTPANRFTTGSSLSDIESTPYIRSTSSVPLVSSNTPTIPSIIASTPLPTATYSLPPHGDMSPYTSLASVVSYSTKLADTESTAYFPSQTSRVRDIPTEFTVSVLPDSRRSDPSIASTLKTNSILSIVVTGTSHPTSVGFTPSKDSGNIVTLVSSVAHSSREKLYIISFKSSPTTLQSLSSTASAFATRTTPHSLSASASFSTVSPSPSSHIYSASRLSEHDNPAMIGGIGASAKEGGKGNPPLLLLIVLLIVIFLFLLVLATLMLLWVYFRRREPMRLKTAKFRSSRHEISVFNPLYVCPSVLTAGVYQDAIQMSDFTDEHGLGISLCDSSPRLQVPPLFLGLNELPRATCSLSKENFTELEVLASGYFGEVMLAYTRGLSLRNRQLVKTGNDGQDSPILVAVKKLQSNPSQSQREAFEKEAQFMSHIKHPNVLRLLGVCVHDSAFIMMEYTEGGDLNQFLQSYSEIVSSTSTPSNTQIATSTLLYMASQISSAMQYLAAFDYIHRDISTRKCVVGKNFLVKLSDLGVNMSTYQSHYYCIRGNKPLPIRWIATESFDGKFSEKSDVWAFGVTMWEMFTLAKQLPYPHLSDEEVIYNALQIEHFCPPTRPNVCPQAVYQIMQQCWAIDLHHRATFQEVNEMFKACI